MTSPDNILPFPSAARYQAGRRLIPGRLRGARKAARMSQGELGDLVGVTRQSVSAYERGDKSPDPDTFERMATALDQPANYFLVEDRPLFGEFSPKFFRKFGSETTRRNEACATLGEWFVQAARYLDDFVNYPDVDIPELAPADPVAGYQFDEIQEAADSCRAQWGLGPGPISNVLALVESKGVAVCRYEMSGENVEAFSFWNGRRPFIFMASEKECGVRTRFDLAHELGHLVLHRWVEEAELEDKSTLKRIEREADRFAGAFLLPQRSFPNEVYTPRLDSFLNLKKRWRVSIQAMIYRCADLGIFDSDQTLNLRKQISFRKWRTKEPYDDPNIIPLEQPRLLRRAVELILEGGRRHPEEILNDLALRPRMIEALYNLPEGTLTGHAPESYEPSLK